MVEASFISFPFSGHDCEFRCTGTRVENAPLIALEGNDLGHRFRHWRGQSGRRSLFSVYAWRFGMAADACPRYPDVVLLAVVRAQDGTRRIVWAGQSGPLPDLVFDGDLMRDAARMGANEIHMHLLAKDGASREALIRDIAG